MPSTSSASASPFPDAGPPPDDLELSREFVEERHRVARILHDAREEIIRFQSRWPHELQVHDPLLNAVITHLRRFIPQMNRTGLTMLNEAVLSNNLNHSTLDNGVWFPYAPELLFPQTEAASADEEVQPVQGHHVSEEEGVSLLDRLFSGSGVPPAQAEERPDAESADEPSSNPAPSSKALGKRRHIDEEEDDGADSPPPSPLKKQRYERSWSPSPSPGISNSLLPIIGVSTSTALAPAQPRSGRSSPRSSPSRSSPTSPRAGRASRSRSGTPPRPRIIIADHVRQSPPSSPDALPREKSIMAVDLGRGGLEIFERREAQWRLAEHNARQAMSPTPALALAPPPVPSSSRLPAAARAPAPNARFASPTVFISDLLTAPLPSPISATPPAPVAPPVPVAPVQPPAPQPPVAAPSAPATSNGTFYLPPLAPYPANRPRLTREENFSTITYFRRAPGSREAAIDAERQAAQRRATPMSRRLQEQEAAAAAAATAAAAAQAEAAAAAAAAQAEAAAADAAPATTTAAGPSRTPKRTPKRRRADQGSDDKTEREEAAASAEEERPAKRRSPSPPVAGPSKTSPSGRARKGDAPKDKGKQPVRRSTRNKGPST